MTTQIEPGDIVHHGPTGEDWYVLGIQAKEGKLCPAGWPHSIADLKDCTLKKKGTGLKDGERASRRAMFPGMRFDDDEASV